MEVLEKLPLCEKISHEISYLDVLNDNQDIDDIKVLFF
jgi:hypothetical protein